MNSPIDINHLLTHRQLATFNELETGQLKDLFVSQLLILQQDLNIEIAHLALDILYHGNKHQEETLKKQINQFFVMILAKINNKTKQSLIKIVDIAQQNLLIELINKFDDKKKKYPSFQAIHHIIDQFHTDKLPVFMEMKMVNPITVQSETPEGKNSLIKKSFKKLRACCKFDLLPQLANEFLTHFNQTSYLQTYDWLFYQLRVKYCLKFEDFEKVKLCKAIFELNSPFRNQRFERCSEEGINEFLKSCLKLKTHCGEEVLGYYLAALNTDDNISLGDMIRGLNVLLGLTTDPSFYMFINQWRQQRFGWTKLFEIVENYSVKSGLNDSLYKENLDQLFLRFKEDSTVQNPLSDEDLFLIKGQYQIVNNHINEHQHFNFNQLINIAHGIRQQVQEKNMTLETDLLLLVAIGCLAIHSVFKIFPYSTQILTLLGILAHGKSKQAQVKTGEGKSTIVALYGFVMAMSCRALDMITSSRHLAQRDHFKYASFFKRCGISTAHICYDHKEPHHFNAQILYGPAFDYEFAWMSDRLFDTKLFEQRLNAPFVKRNFDCACVDESDNLLVDTAANGARLSFPAEFCYDWIYPHILLYVRINEDQSVANLRSHLANHVSQENQNKCKYLPDKQLKIWLKSAHCALFEYKESVNYVIGKKQNSEGQISRSIQIVDLQTGRISKNSRWSNGVHEFLEVKHDIEVEKESLTPISLSHAVFYEFYRTITALTGTAEQYQTKQIYHIESFDVPPYRPLQRVDLPPIFVNREESYKETILEMTRKFVSLKRPLLILCKTIEDTDKLASFLKEKGINCQLLNEMQEELEHQIVSKAGAPGKVTIATNTAGRGTDISLSDESVQNGGLHVLLTFYPDSKREENQAIGRAGRQGEPGSSQIILNRESPEIKAIISDRVMTDAELILELNLHRLKQEMSQGICHLVRAELERFLGIKTHQFFDAFQLWSGNVSREAFLEKHGRKLCSIKLNSKKQLVFNHLSGSDLLIAEECKRLLMTPKIEILSWKILLNKTIERLRQKIIREWAIEFFQPIEEYIRSSGNIDKIKLEIKEQFALSQQNWEKYLNPDGSGVFVFLQELTTINLLPKLAFQEPVLKL